MKKLLLIFASAALIVGACERTPENLPESAGLSYVKTSLEVIPGQYVVLLKADFGYVKSAGVSYDESQLAMTGITKNLLAESGIAYREPLNVYSASIAGFAVKLSDSELAQLKKNSNIRGIWPDMMFILAKPGTTPSQPAEQIPGG